MAYGSNISKCRSCGEQIIWIRTKAGKNMPCNTTLLNYKLDPKGKDNIVKDTGEVIRCNAQGVDAAEADGYGYLSHFATCPYARAHRR